MIKKTFLILFRLFIATAIIAQPACHITEYTMNDGLSQDIISTILQDQKGFMWMATRNGLTRFDGYTFKNYKSSLRTNHHLSNNRILSIAETRYGDIWCKTYDSKAYIFDTSNEVFYPVLETIEKEKRRNSSVKNIYPLKKGVAWIICEQGYCYRVDENKYKDKDGITLYDTYNGLLKGNKVFNVYQDSEEDEWILTDEGITIVGNKQIDSTFPFKFMEEYNGRIYLISVSEKLAYYDLSSGKIEFVDTPSSIKHIHWLKPIRNHILSLATDNGVVLFDTEKNFSDY